MALKFPKISIVTPSYNQGQFLEATIKSVLDQNYPNLQYVIIDGESTDNSVEIIKKYQDRLSYWVSEKDKGMYDAINKGFQKTNGEIMAWLNSDDMFTPWSFSVIAEIFSQFQDVHWITSLFPIWWDVHGRAIRTFYRDGYGKGGFMRGEHLPRPGEYAKYYIQQESTFWRRALWEKAGGRLEEGWQNAGDFDLWARFFQHAELVGVETSLGGARRHHGQKTINEIENYFRESDVTFKRLGIKYYSPWQVKILNYLLNIIPKRLRSVAYKLGINHYREALFNTGRTLEWKKKRWK